MPIVICLQVVVFPARFCLSRNLALLMAESPFQERSRSAYRGCNPLRPGQSLPVLAAPCHDLDAER